MMKIAAIQMISSDSVSQNIQTVESLVGKAAEAGAQFVALPEYWVLMGQRDQDKVDIAEPYQHGPLQTFMSNLARKHNICILGGTIPLKSPEPNKVLNTCLVYDSQGQEICRYDKIHLFGFNNGRESYQESKTITQGALELAKFDLGWGDVLPAICYDLRFPEYFRRVKPCSLIVLPAAFTYTTGAAHWEVLLRARAIENQCYVLASAQGGTHNNGRRTWGHSMLINPWGEIIDCLPEGEGYVAGELDLAFMSQTRENLPALQHCRL